MQLSPRRRYGIRRILALAPHYHQGPIQFSDIAERLDASGQYWEQIIIPVKKTPWVKSIRGPKGGPVLDPPPEEIKVGEIAAVLADGVNLVECPERPDSCSRAENCLTRHLWREAGPAMFATLNFITPVDLVNISQVESPGAG